MYKKYMTYFNMIENHRNHIYMCVWVCTCVYVRICQCVNAYNDACMHMHAITYIANKRI